MRRPWPIDWLNDSQKLRRFHGYATVVWLGLVVPSVTVWRESIGWVVFMSVWANVAGHWSSWQAARAEQKAS